MLSLLESISEKLLPPSVTAAAPGEAPAAAEEGPVAVEATPAADGDLPIAAEAAPAAALPAAVEEEPSAFEEESGFLLVDNKETRLRNSIDEVLGKYRVAPVLEGWNIGSLLAAAKNPSVNDFERENIRKAVLELMDVYEAEYDNGMYVYNGTRFATLQEAIDASLLAMDRPAQAAGNT
jgi:hypothetical protein